MLILLSIPVSCTRGFTLTNKGFTCSTLLQSPHFNPKTVSQECEDTLCEANDLSDTCAVCPDVKVKFFCAHGAASDCGDDKRLMEDFQGWTRELEEKKREEERKQREKSDKMTNLLRKLIRELN